MSQKPMLFSDYPHTYSMTPQLDPVVLFFVLGAFAALVKSDLRIPKSFYELLSIYLLLAIGIKGGIEMFHNSIHHPVFTVSVLVVAGASLTIVAYSILRFLLRMDHINANAIAMHFGSVSAVTYAVASSYVHQHGLEYEPYLSVALVLLEIPGLATGVLIQQLYMRSHKGENAHPDKKTPTALEVIHEVLFNKSILLLLGGLGIGYYIEYSANTQLNYLFKDMFKGFLAIFLVELGIITAERFRDFKTVGIKLFFFALGMPFIGAFLGIAVGALIGLSVGGTVVLAAMMSSASYIAAPATAKLTLPTANPTYYMTVALGITFPFNITVGISIYHWLVIHFIP
jgi:uncharacterized protein